MTPDSARALAKLLLSAVLLCIVAAFAYACYGAETGTGLAGYLLALQLNAVGRGSMLLTIISTTAILSIPPIALTLALSRLSPSFERALTELVKGKNPGLTPPQPMGAELTWRVICIVPIVILLISILVAGTLFVMNRQDQSAGTYQIHLDHEPAALPNGVAYLKLTGNLARPYLAAFTERSSRSSTSNMHVFAPVTEASWTKEKPVQYFVHYEARNAGDSPQLPPAFESPGPTEFTGSVSSSLPVFVAQQYTQKGLTLAPKYRVLDWQPLPETGTPESYSHYIALGIGVFVALIAFGSLAGGKLLTRAATRRARAANG